MNNIAGYNIRPLQFCKGKTCELLTQIQVQDIGDICRLLLALLDLKDQPVQRELWSFSFNDALCSANRLLEQEETRFAMAEAMKNSSVVEKLLKMVEKDHFVSLHQQMSKTSALLLVCFGSLLFTYPGLGWYPWEQYSEYMARQGADDIAEISSFCARLSHKYVSELLYKYDPNKCLPKSWLPQFDAAIRLCLGVSCNMKVEPHLRKLVDSTLRLVIHRLPEISVFESLTERSLALLYILMYKLAFSEDTMKVKVLPNMSKKVMSNLKTTLRNLADASPLANELNMWIFGNDRTYKPSGNGAENMLLIIGEIWELTNEQLQGLSAAVATKALGVNNDVQGTK